MITSYREDIFDLFRAAHERDKAQFIPDWISSWSYQDNRVQKDAHYRDDMPQDFYGYDGPIELVRWLNWSLAPKPDYIPDRILRPLIERSTQFDKRVLRENGLEFDFTGYENGLARNNAQDYFLPNAYPMVPQPTHSCRILDFGSGAGRQANLWNQMEDEGLTFISMDGIPQPYCVQHFYYSHFDRPYFDYIVDPNDFSLTNNSRGIYHLPTWRFDLIPDNYLDKIVTVQVLPELGEELVRYVCEQFRRCLKPSGILYIRDHKNWWHPVHPMDIDEYFCANGFVKVFSPHIEDKVDFFGTPRIFRIVNQRVLEQEKEGMENYLKKQQSNG